MSLPPIDEDKIRDLLPDSYMRLFIDELHLNDMERLVQNPLICLFRDRTQGLEDGSTWKWANEELDKLSAKYKENDDEPKT